MFFFLPKIMKEVKNDSNLNLLFFLNGGSLQFCMRDTILSHKSLKLHIEKISAKQISACKFLSFIEIEFFLS